MNVVITRSSEHSHPKSTPTAPTSHTRVVRAASTIEEPHLTSLMVHDGICNDTPSKGSAPAQRLSGSALWAILFLGVTLLESIARLGVRAAHVIRAGLDLREWAIFVFIVAVFAYFEGHRALARRFIPRFTQKALTLTTSQPAPGRWLPRVFAPLYALSLLDRDRKMMFRTWSGVGLIGLAIAIVRHLPPFWRGAADAGVSVALAWGLIALVQETVRATRAATKSSGR